MEVNFFFDLISLQNETCLQFSHLINFLMDYSLNFISQTFFFPLISVLRSLYEIHGQQSSRHAHQTK